MAIGVAVVGVRVKRLEFGWKTANQSEQNEVMYHGIYYHYPYFPASARRKLSPPRPSE